MAQSPPARMPLPVDQAIPEILATLETQASLVIEAAPGTGKTTRIPPALLAAPFARGKQIWVLEPRRLAAKLAARRVAQELGEEVGQTIGYQFRFEKVSSPATRVLFLTEGLLLRKLMQDPELTQVAAVVLDEFHERHLQTDLAISVLRKLQQEQRADLKLLVMSATLDADSISAYLGGAERLRIEGQRYPVDLHYLPEPSQRPLEVLVRDALQAAFQKKAQGDALVFLPGMGEMLRAQEQLRPWVQQEKISLHLLHGDLSKSEQDEAVRPHPRGVRKIILSTNIAESSLTIDGVSIVIDSGLARVASFSPWSGLPSLKTKFISRASCVQRMGRAGRQQPGLCFRLFARGEFDARPLHDIPEIHRADLTQSALELLRTGVGDPRSLTWFERPKEQGLESSLELLHRLGACVLTPNAARSTPFGNRLAHLPLHPRLGKLVLEAKLRGYHPEGAMVAHALTEGGFPGSSSNQSDFIEDFERYQKSLSSQSGRADSFDRGVRQILAGLKEEEDSDIVRSQGSAPGTLSPDLLAQLLLMAFPDRVAKRKVPDSRLKDADLSRAELLLCMGGSAWLEDEALARSSEWFVIVDAEEKQFPGEARPKNRVRKAISIDPSWLLEPSLGLLEEKVELVFDRDRGRVEQALRLRYGNLVLDESRSLPRDAEAAATFLLDQVISTQEESWSQLFARDVFLRLQARVDFLKRHASVMGLSAADLEVLPPLSGPEFRKWFELQLAVRGLFSIPAIRASGPIQWILEELHASALGQKIEQWVPETVALPRRKNCPIHYEVGKDPWVESRLQDFLGLKVGPSLLGGKIPLTLHLLAPNYRAVQVTKDLAGFWARIYPDLRRELGRRYPRHAWPEDPYQPEPTSRGPN